MGRIQHLALGLLFTLSVLGTASGATLPITPIGGAPPLRAAEDSGFAVTRAHNRAVAAIHSGFHRILKAIAARSKDSTHYEATLVSAFLDDSSRSFFYMTGRLKAAAGARGVARKLEKLEGYTLSTNGPLGIDLAFPELERDSSGEVSGLTFSLTVTALPGQIVDTLTGVAVKVATLGAFSFVNGGLIPFLENFNADLVGNWVSNTVGDMALVMAQDAGEEGIIAATGGDVGGLGEQRASRLHKHFKDGVSPGAILRYMGDLILQTGRQEGNRIAGAVLGSVVGAAIGHLLFPAGGAVIGALVSLVAMPIIGQVVANVVTINIPVWYRTSRLISLYRKKSQTLEEDEGVEAAIHKHEEKLMARVRGGIESEDYDFFDKLAGRLGRLDPEERALLGPFVEKVLDSLRFAMVADSNWHAARKYQQILIKLKR